MGEAGLVERNDLACGGGKLSLDWTGRLHCMAWSWECSPALFDGHDDMNGLVYEEYGIRLYDEGKDRLRVGERSGKDASGWSFAWQRGSLLTSGRLVGMA